jgi:N-acetylmuramoyl-L-alanine amidase
MTTPEEAPPRDVTTTNRANAQSTEFDKSEEEQEVKANAAASRSRGTATSSSDMAGWELVRYQERDYVPASSLHKFYRFNTLEVDGNNVWFKSPVLVMKATLGSQDLLINNIKFVLSDPVIELQGKPCFSRLDLCKLIDPVLRPSYIGSGSTFDTVILDPGHGGHDSGARGIYGYEKDFALKLAFALKADLEKRGLKVVMTRRDDTYISLGGRVAYANKIPNSVYVSLHFNSGQSSATGIETFAFTPQGASSEYGARAVDASSFNGNQRDSENIALATAIHASVVHHFRLVDRGVKRARWYVLKGLERPGVLFEGGFVTNANDAKFIAADNFRTELATTLGQAIVNYRRALQPRSDSRP